jgi:hypothetical protein|tara:strand:- start:240 stop:539 length:300 start_codon:yes stop_codon:yes gene_type:complete
MVNKNLKISLSLVVIGLVLLFTVSLFLIKYSGEKTDEEKEEYLDWLGDNCDCVERERLKCSGEFELDEERRLCVKEDEITSVLLGCSMYNCSGEINKVE